MILCLNREFGIPMTAGDFIGRELFYLCRCQFVFVLPYIAFPVTLIDSMTRMWANAQRDGRPAEHRWRPLFNAAKFGCLD